MSAANRKASLSLGIPGTYFYASGKSGWAIRYRNRQSGRRKAETLPQTNEQLAFAEAMRRAVEWSRGLYDPFEDRTAESVTLRLAVDAYLAHNPALSPLTLRERRIVLGKLSRTMPTGAPLATVTASHMTDFLHRRGLADSTVAGYRSKLHSFYKWAVSEGLCRVSPMNRVPKARTHGNAPRYMTREQVADIVAEAERVGADWVAVAVHLSVSTGLRLGELCAATWSQIGESPEGRFIRVANTKRFRTKSGRDRHVPLFPMAEEALAKAESIWE